MNAKSFREFIISLESKSYAKELVVSNICFWPLLRVYIASKNYEVENYNVLLPEKEGRTISEKVLHAFSVLKVTLVSVTKIFKLLMLRNRKIDFLTLSLDQYNTVVQDKIFNRFMDSFACEMTTKNINIASFENSNGNILKGERFRHTILLDGFFSSSRVLAKILKNKFLLEFPTDFVTDLKTERMSLDLEETKIRIRTIIFLSFFFRFLLKCIKPKVILISNYYSDFGFALIIASRKEKVPTYDVQHGLISPYHFSYSYWSKPNLYHDLLPDGFIVWSDHEKRILSSAFPEKEVLVSGNIWINYWFQNCSKTMNPLKQIVPAGKKVVCFSGQETTLPNVVLDLIEETKFGAFWLIRMHPLFKQEMAHLKEQIARAGLNDCVEIEESTSLPLPFLLDRSDFHVTKSSTVSVEAGYFGVPTLFLDHLGIETFSEVIPDYLIVSRKDFVDQMRPSAFVKSPDAGRSVPVLGKGISSLFFKEVKGTSL